MMFAWLLVPHRLPSCLMQQPQQYCQKKPTHSDDVNNIIGKMALLRALVAGAAVSLPHQLIFQELPPRSARGLGFWRQVRPACFGGTALPKPGPLVEHPFVEHVP